MGWRGCAVHHEARTKAYLGCSLQTLSASLLRRPRKPRACVFFMCACVPVSGCLCTCVYVNDTDLFRYSSVRWCAASLIYYYEKRIDASGCFRKQLSDMTGTDPRTGEKSDRPVLMPPLLLTLKRVLLVFRHWEVPRALLSTETRYNSHSPFSSHLQGLRWKAQLWLRRPVSTEGKAWLWRAKRNLSCF